MDEFSASTDSDQTTSVNELNSRANDSQCQPQSMSATDVGIEPNLSQIGPKWDKSGTF